MLSSTEVNTGAQYRSGVTAQYLAESGARWAAIQLKNDVSAVVDATDSLVGATYGPIAIGTQPAGGSYSVIIRRNPDFPADSSRRQVVATGTVGRAIRQIVYVTTLGGGGLPLKYAAFSGNNLTVAGTINGDVGAKKNVTLKWGYSTGPIKATQIKYPNNTTSAGTPPSETLEFALPAMPVSFDINNVNYQQYLSAATNRASGNLNNAVTTWPNNNYINGNLALTGSTILSTTGNAGIYVNGNFAIHSNCTINAAGDLAIIVNGTITLDPGQINVAAGKTLTLYAKNGVTATSGAKITGNTTIVSPGAVSFSGGSKITIVDGGVINVYTQQNFTSSGGMYFGTANPTIQNGTITVMSSANIRVTGGVPFNPGTNGTVKLYAGGTFSLSGGSSLAGFGLVMTGDTGSNSIKLDGGSSAKNTVFLSSGGLYSSIVSGPVYAKKDMELDYGANVYYDETIFSMVGLNAGGEFAMSPWNNH